MTQLNQPGQIIILNGAPRAGKSSIVTVIQETFEGPWMNLGVDVFKERIIPQRYSPAIGLRPGGEALELEPLIVVWYAALYESVAAHSRLGLNVVVDAGHHDSYSLRRGILFDSARRLRGLPVLFVGVRCPIEIIMERRRKTWGQGGSATEPLPGPVQLWQREVHDPGIYDLEVDTSLLSPEQCAALIRRRLEAGPRPGALRIMNSDEDAHVRAMAIEVVGQYVHTNPVAEQALVETHQNDASPAVRKKAGWYAPGGPIHRRTAPRPARKARRR